MGKRIILGMLIIAFLSPNGLFSKEGMLKELKTEIQNYSKKNIIPVLKESKIAFDKTLKADELKKLDILRKEATIEKNIIKGEIKEKMADFKPEKGKRPDIDKEKIEASKSKIKDLAKELRPIAEAHKDELKAFGEKMKPQIEKWRNDIKEITERWKSEHAKEIEQLKEKNGGKMRGLNEKAPFGDMDKKKALVKFLLWDGSEDFDFQEQSR
jgi:hypothetical protein